MLTNDEDYADDDDDDGDDDCADNDDVCRITINLMVFMLLLNYDADPQ